jgi:cation diffusion facilitator CzcD-associated flavoprotein CzcO
LQAFPFDPNPDWTTFYSKGSEIHDYFKSTTKKWNLDRDLELDTKVVSALWQETEGKWKLTVEHAGVQRVELCDILISGQGNLV